MQDSMAENISAASGETKAELVLKHASIVNVFTEEIEQGDIAINLHCSAGAFCGAEPGV